MLGNARTIHAFPLFLLQPHKRLVLELTCCCFEIQTTVVMMVCGIVLKLVDWEKRSSVVYIILRDQPDDSDHTSVSVKVCWD